MTQKRPPRGTRAWKPDLKAIPTGKRAAMDMEVGSSGKGGVDGQKIGGTSKPVAWLNFVKLPHTVFALPFALLGVVYASGVHAVTPGQVFLVLVAFTAARFAAMGFNRLVDREWDARNPRTSQREIPKGVLSPTEARIAVLLASLVFVASAAALNPLCGYLSIPALLWILGYSYTKRFTSWSHLWLGGALSIAPAGGYLAVTGSWSTPAWTLVVLAGAVLFWVAGFDMFYALQDEIFDREHGLKSAVVLLGERRSILVAKLLHGITIGGLITFGWGAGMGLYYFVGIGVAAAILAWEHNLVKPGDVSRVDAAFFMFNGVMSIVVFAGSLADRVIG